MARLSSDWGGSCMYLPKGDALRRMLRNAWIWNEFDGAAHGPRGVHALAWQTGLSTVRTYSILTCQRALHRRTANGAPDHPPVAPSSRQRDTNGK